MNLSGIGALCKKKFNNVFCPIIVVMWLGNCSSQQVSNGGNHIGFWHIRRIYRDENMAPEVFMSFISSCYLSSVILRLRVSCYLFVLDNCTLDALSWCLWSLIYLKKTK